MLGLSERQLRGWEKAGLIEPVQTYGFPQLVALRALAKLKEANLPALQIRRAVSAVRARLRDLPDPLTQVKLYSDGHRIRVQLGGQKMEAVSGQLLLDFDEAEMERLVALPSREQEDLAAAVRKKQLQAETWFLRGVEMEQANEPVDKIIDAYRLAVSLDPALAAAQVNLGTIYFNTRDFARAEKYYQRAIEANPRYPLAHFNLGNLYDERGDRAKALTHYLMAIRLDSQYADAHYNLALLYQGAGETMKAVRHWRIYLKLDPSSAWTEVARRELDKLYASTVVRGNGPRNRTG